MSEFRQGVSKRKTIQNDRVRFTFFRSFPLMWHKRLIPSKHMASSLPFPNIFVTWAYSWPSSLKINSLFSASFSFFPLLRFFPPFPVRECDKNELRVFNKKKTMCKASNSNRLYPFQNQMWLLTIHFTRLHKVGDHERWIPSVSNGKNSDWIQIEEKTVQLNKYLYSSAWWDVCERLETNFKSKF